MNNKNLHMIISIQMTENGQFIVKLSPLFNNKFNAISRQFLFFDKMSVHNQEISEYYWSRWFACALWNEWYAINQYLNTELYILFICTGFFHHISVSCSGVSLCVCACIFLLCQTRCQHCEIRVCFCLCLCPYLCVYVYFIQHNKCNTVTATHFGKIFGWTNSIV